MYNKATVKNFKLKKKSEKPKTNPRMPTSPGQSPRMVQVPGLKEEQSLNNCYSEISLSS